MIGMHIYFSSSRSQQDDSTGGLSASLFKTGVQHTWGTEDHSVPFRLGPIQGHQTCKFVIAMHYRFTVPFSSRAARPIVKTRCAAACTAGVSPSMRKLKLPIPTSIITGSLGVGKTTALCNLVSRKPADEYWCVIVNEFGAVGIDAVALQSSAAAAAGGTVAVKQIAGGCMCCAQAGLLLPAIAQLIRQTKPDRLLIEPSGLGHPGGLLDILQGPHLGSSLQLNALICLVDLSSFEPTKLAKNPTAWDQITIADILVGSKADAATPAAAEAFQSWASEELFPPKSQVLLLFNGHLSLACLDAPRSAAAAAGLLCSTRTRSSRARQQQHHKQQQQQRKQQQQQQDATQAELTISSSSAAVQAAAGSTNGVLTDSLQQLTVPDAALQQADTCVQGPTTQEIPLDSREPLPGMPVKILGRQANSSSSSSTFRLPAASSGSTSSSNNQSIGGSNKGGVYGSSSNSSSTAQHTSCGWVFHESEVFDQQQLLQLLQALQPVVARIKGVFRVGVKQWVMPAAASLPAVETSTNVAAAAAAAAAAGSGLRDTADLAKSTMAAAAAAAADAPAGLSESADTMTAYNSAAGATKPADEIAGCTTAGGATADRTGSSSSSSSSSVLQLQEVCYRGPSMVEVILADGDAGQSFEQKAAAVCVVLQAASSLGGMGGVQQQPQSTSSQQQQQPQPSNGDCSGGSMHSLRQKGADSTAAAAAAAVVAADLQAVSLNARGAGDSASDGAMVGQWDSSGHGTVTTAAGQQVWMQLEAALQACLKPQVEA